MGENMWQTLKCRKMIFPYNTWAGMLCICDITCHEEMERIMSKKFLVKNNEEKVEQHYFSVIS